MTRHQRCRNAIAGLPVDRTPTYLPALSCQVASALLGRKAYCGTGSLHYAEVLAWSNGEQAHADFEAQLFNDLADIQRLLDIDVCRMPWRINRRPTKKIDDTTFLFGKENGPHEIWSYQPRSGDFGLVSEVSAYASPEEFLQANLKDEESAAANAATNQQRHRNNHTQFANRFGKEFFVVSMYGGITVGIDEISLMATALEPDLSARRMIAQADLAIEWGRWLATSGFPPVMLGGGDMASSTGPIYSPDTFRKVLLPAYQKTADALNPLGVHYAFRSDGNLGLQPGAIADQLFAEAQIPGFGEVDRDAGMTIEILRRRYPALVLWGQVSSAFLASATPAQIKDHCKKLLEANGNTRYFHACSNAIVQSTPPANVLALYSVR